MTSDAPLHLQREERALLEERLRVHPPTVKWTETDKDNLLTFFKTDTGLKLLATVAGRKQSAANSALQSDMTNPETAYIVAQKRGGWAELNNLLDSVVEMATTLEIDDAR